MKRQLLSYLAGALFLCKILSGCGGEQFTYVPPQEIKPGPGLLSGKNGEFTLVGSQKSEEGD